MRRVRGVVGVVALIGALMVTGGDAARAAIPDEGLGFQEQAPFLIPLSDAEIVRELDAAQEAGMKHMRFMLRWDSLEPNGPGQWDQANLAKADRIVDLARARGIEPLPILDLAPIWARGLLSTPYSPPTDPAMFGAFAGRVARHFGTRVNAYEIWNEPNLIIFWGGPPDPAGYTRLLKAAYPAIKAANPNATVLAAAGSPEGDGLLSMGPATYYRGMYSAGAKGFFDAAAAHPYTWYKKDAWTTDVDAIHALMVANGDGHKKIWITENGASTSTGPEGMSEAAQRDYILAAADEAARRPFVGPMIIYCIRDIGTNKADREQNFGLLRLDFSPKPAHDALVALASAGTTAAKAKTPKRTTAGAKAKAKARKKKTKPPT